MAGIVSGIFRVGARILPRLGRLGRVGASAGDDAVRAGANASKAAPQAAKASKAAPQAAKAAAGRGSAEFGAASSKGGLKGLGSSPVTKRGMLATHATLMAAPVAAITVDNLSDNFFSRSLMSVPVVGTAIKTTLNVMGFANEQTATFLTNHVTRYLEDQGRLNPDDPDYDKYVQMIKASSHVATGDFYGAIQESGQLNLSQAEYVDALEKALRENPEASQEEIGLIVFDDLKAREAANSLALEAGQGLENKADNALDSETPSVSKRAKDRAGELVDDFGGRAGAVIDNAKDGFNFGNMLADFFKGVLNFITLGLFSDAIYGRVENIVDEAETNDLDISGNGVLANAGYGEDFTPDRGPEYDPDLAMA